jgi:hypothetical protein
MNKKQLKFYEFMKSKCEYKKCGLDQNDLRCIKNKKDIKTCNINNCFYIKQENKGLLNPAMKLLRIINIPFYHIGRTKTSARDAIKSNEGLPDLAIFLDYYVYFMEFKIDQNKLEEKQKEIAELLIEKNYSKYNVVNNLQDFYYNIMSYLSEKEEKKVIKNIIKVKKWMDENNIED